MGANKPVAPASLLQVGGAGRVVGKKSLELWERLWEPKIATLVNVHEHGRTLPLVAVGDNRIGKIRTYAATTRGSDVIVHGFFVDGVLRGAADLRLNRREAEVAFSIEKRWQSLGIGSALLERSLLVARNRGIKRLEVCCLMENQRMQQLARKFEAELTFDFGTVIGKMENPHPTPLSVMQEMAVDGHSFAAAYVDFQSRLLMPPMRRVTQ